MGAFYAPHTEEGKQILQNKTSSSGESIRSYTKGISSRSQEAVGTTRGPGSRARGGRRISRAVPEKGKHGCPEKKDSSQAVDDAMGVSERILTSTEQYATGLERYPELVKPGLDRAGFLSPIKPSQNPAIVTVLSDQPQVGADPACVYLNIALRCPQLPGARQVLHDSSTLSCGGDRRV